MPQGGTRGGFSFMAMVGGVMALLKAKEKYDEYREVAADDDEGRVALTSADPLSDPRRSGEGPIALLNTEVPATRARRPQKKKACCLCCGVDCSLLFKALGIVIGLYTLYLGFKAVRWALTDSPTGLEGMPTFGESWGCSDASFTYEDKLVHTSALMGTRSSEHKFDVKGHGLGTITIADGDSSTDEIKYEILIKTNKQELLSDVSLDLPSREADGSVPKSRFILQTSGTRDDSSCMKYDVKIFVPPKLKKLDVALHTPAQVRFEEGSKINVDMLHVTMYALEEKNLILTNKDVAANKLVLEVHRGWIVGEASIIDEVSIMTQRGDGVANVKFYAALPADGSSPKPVGISTATGTGRSDFFFIGHPGFKRRISSNHISSKNGDVYLTYKQAKLNGKIKLESKSFTATGLRPFPEPRSGWTHFVGSEDGEDEITVNSRGWTGLYV